jgi:hypothetical protein
VPYLALEATRVIWMTALPFQFNTGNVYACPKEGCGSAPMLLAGSFRGGAMGSDGVTAWLSQVGTGTEKIVKVGASGLEVYSGLSKGPVVWITPRDASLLVNVYYEGDSGAFSRTIYRADVTQQTFQLVAQYASQTVNTDNTVFTKTHVYLGAHNFGSLLAAPLAGGSFTEVLSGDVVGAMTTDGDRVYFSDSSGPVYSCAGDGNLCVRGTVLVPDPKLGGAPQLLFAAQGRLFIETAGGALVSCDPANCTATAIVLAKEDALATEWHFSGYNIAVDAQSVYYVARKSVSGGDPKYVIKRVAREAK